MWLLHRSDSASCEIAIACSFFTSGRIQLGQFEPLRRGALCAKSAERMSGERITIHVAKYRCASARDSVGGSCVT